MLRAKSKGHISFAIKNYDEATRNKLAESTTADGGAMALYEHDGKYLHQLCGAGADALGGECVGDYCWVRSESSCWSVMRRRVS